MASTRRRQRKAAPDVRERILTALEASITEEDFQQQIIDLARYCGYRRIYHTWNSKHSESGFPDLVLCKPGHALIFFEVKDARREVEDAQAAWIEDLATTGVLAKVVRPSDWTWISKVLQGEPVSIWEAHP